MTTAAPRLQFREPPTGLAKGAHLVADKLSLADLVPAKTLENLRRQFEAVTGVGMAFTGADGIAITAVDDPLRFCGSIVRTPERMTYCLRRRKWDEPEEELEQELREDQGAGEPYVHRCRGRFRDMATPIVVEDQLLGYAVFARTLLEAPDVGRFRELAVGANMDPDLGEEIAHHATVMSEDRLAAIAAFVQALAQLVVSAAYDELRARQVIELEELRDALVHMIIHDLRTPLTSIIGSLETIVDGEYEAETTGVLVPMALASSEELLEMVNTLLDINKMESGKMRLDNVKEIRFSELAQAASAQVNGLLQEYGHELDVKVDPPDATLVADEDLLRRVVVNLLGNAIKFTQGGGHIRLTARGTEDGLTISVEDNGPGIPPEDRERVFEKFGQAQARKEGRKHSTGLGLTFCKMAAEAHGGRIWLESEVGKGSTFYVFIPRELPGAN